MRFLQGNWEALILVFLTMMSEVFHLLFVNVPFWDEGINLDAPLYFFVSQFGLLNFVPSIIIFTLINPKRRASRGIMFGLILWNVKEVMDEIFYMAGTNLNVFETNSSFWGQIMLISTIVGLSYFGFTKWKS